MTRDQIAEVANLYLKELVGLGEKPKHNLTAANPNKLQHAGWMCQQILLFVEENSHYKACRWLGFVQGILWLEGIYTVDEMREHNSFDR
jgi:hypothetical protein